MQCVQLRDGVSRDTWGRCPICGHFSRKCQRKVIKGLQPILLAQCRQVLTRVIEKCWDLSPNTRPNFSGMCIQLWHLKCMLMIGMSILTNWSFILDKTSIRRNYQMGSLISHIISQPCESSAPLPLPSLACDNGPPHVGWSARCGSWRVNKNDSNLIILWEDHSEQIGDPMTFTNRFLPNVFVVILNTLQILFFNFFANCHCCNSNQHLVWRQPVV